MKLEPTSPRHTYEVIITTQQNSEDAKREGSRDFPPIVRNDQVYSELFNDRFRHVRMKIPDGIELNEDIILFHREVMNEVVGLSATMMGVGKISAILGLADVIPSSGPIDIQLLGMLIHYVARSLKWIGADHGCARALCFYQKNMPTEPHFERLQFLFPGTIVFNPQLGICIPMVNKKGDKWVVQHRNILDEVIPGVDLWVR